MIFYQATSEQVKIETHSSTIQTKLYTNKAVVHGCKHMSCQSYQRRENLAPVLYWSSILVDVTVILKDTIFPQGDGEDMDWKECRLLGFKRTPGSALPARKDLP
jgi:hypothetical protein